MKSRSNNSAALIAGGVLVEKRAVVDIGSNSVRLVIYDGPCRAPIAICNEKALCGLGRDMIDEGMLNPDAVSFALSTLARFARLLDEHGSPPVHVIATAAVRDAKDGKKFISAVRKLGFEVSLLSGGEEAALAAMGVVSFEPGATGLAGDMGGGSLELVALKDGKIGERTSLPIGPFSIMRRAPKSSADALKYIERELDRVDFLTDGRCKVLYSVGGAWRAIARIHMRLRSYPLSMLHHYELSSAEAIEICELISRQSRRSLEDIPGIPRRRVDTLPYAAMVLKSVLKRTGAKKIVISAGGVREGILYDELSSDNKKTDPLIEGSRFYADRLSPEACFGDAAYEMIEPIFKSNGDDKARLRFATCLLMDIGAYFHPEKRARHAYDEALRAPLVGISHSDRVWMAMALYCRYQGRSTPPPQEQMVGFLSWEEQQTANQFGLAMRFAATFAPKISDPLVGCYLSLEDDRLIFRAPTDREVLMGEMPRKRLDALAASLEVKAQEVYA